MTSSSRPVIEIGGTHVAAALVDPGDWSVVPESTAHLPLDSGAPAEALLDSLAAAPRAVPDSDTGEWTVAIPGPFDYAGGIGRFENVGKFDSLRGVDVGRALLERLGSRATRIRFLNDADAFGVGEFAAGAARGHARAICITLGTGVGSAFLDDGDPVNDGPLVPPDGSAHLIEHRGEPLEETVSRRAIRRAYAEATGDRDADVRDIALAARDGDGIAARMLEAAFCELGRALAPFVLRFGASVLVVGGSIARSWDLIPRPLGRGLAAVDPALERIELAAAQHPGDAALLGAAHWGLRHEDTLKS